MPTRGRRPAQACANGALAAAPGLSGIGALRIGEVDGEEPMRAVETLELYLAALGEFDSRIRDELPDEIRDENLPTERLACNPRGVVNGGAEEAIRLLDRITRVNADPDPDRG